MSTDDLRSGTKKTATSAGANPSEAESMADHVASIRDEIDGLKHTVTDIANRQMGRAQDMAREKAYEAEDAIRKNPLQAVAIAAGLGFLFGVFTRR
ncbi:hypothetical protein A7A08_00102 [Methyloligella halotolerans]|uniref:DUF883 domain-containing protein n=1 Tax=Methyloligella halotolerans TaxID=1177755 RepID=A0A1E2S1F9_9HYPH|nr:DUF883 family protein [Methyloligella halotolerans]ODA68284.1 hypothetical protein A7A08_00102 [Methyloligella halotolerans]